ncbi:MAG: protein jag [Oscillospiraceae bacterium]|jgi:spoIIIJ-associated protein|nr:protein jag [Oscillospiraceae bacterium]
MNSIEVSARTIEEAVSDGLARLGCSISDCKVEILHEGAKGLFGFFGSKPATVRLTLLADEGEGELEMKLPASLERSPEKAKPHKKPETEAVVERFRTAPLPRADKPAPEAPKPAPRAPRPPRAPMERPPRQEREERAPIAHEPVPAPEHIEMYPADTLEGCAQQFLLAVTKRMGVDIQAEVHKNEEGHLFVTLYGDTLGILIGRRGETLDALQYLTSLQVNRGREQYTRVTLDTENYRAKREEALTRLADRMANRAIKTGRKVALEPMNPYERRILHASLQGNPGVTTHSEGDEPYRHVVVVPQKAQ